MTLDPDNRARLLKTLRLTESLNDHEVAAAARRANALLGVFGETWETALRAPDPDSRQREAYARDARHTGGVPKDNAPKKANVRDVEADEIRRMFAEIAEADVESDFLESLAEQFEERGRLTPRQVDALRKWHERSEK